MIESPSRSRGNSWPLPIPCWPNPSRLVLFLTRDVDRFTFPYLTFCMPLIIAPLFVFDDFVGQVLHSIGYNNLVLLRGQYAYASSKVDHLNFADFQILELVVWLSITIWGIRLFLGIIFLREYDRRFLRVSETHRGAVYGAPIMGVGGVYVSTDTELAFHAPAFLLLLRSVPELYFWIMSVLCFCSLWLFSAGTLFVIWKLFRQNWPGAVLWRDDLEQKGKEP